MRYFLIALAMVAPLAAHAGPQIPSTPVWEDGAAAGVVIPAVLDNDAAGPLQMTLSPPRPTGGMPGALSGTFNAEASTDLLDMTLDEIVEAKAELLATPIKGTTMPPLAGAWLRGLARPAVLLPEPFSYSILSIGLLGFIISRFYRAP